MKYYISVILLILTYTTVDAQKRFEKKHFTHDFGFLIGPYSIQTDYGPRDGFTGEIGNAGLSLSLVHYLSFYNRQNKWNARSSFFDDVAIKTELNYLSNSTLKITDKYIQGGADINAQKLRALEGTVNIFNVGVSAEYYFLSLREFSAQYSSFRWNPYINIGLMYSSYKNTFISYRGDWTQDLSILPSPYNKENVRAVGSGSTGSIILGGGTRFKINEKLDFVSNLRWQYFLNDNVDGLKQGYILNNYNEWVASIQIGFVWHLNFSNSLF